MANPESSQNKQIGAKLSSSQHVSLERKGAKIDVTFTNLSPETQKKKKKKTCVLM